VVIGKITTDKTDASRGHSAIAELLVAVEHISVPVCNCIIYYAVHVAFHLL